MVNKILLSVVLFCMLQTAQSSQYFLCGPDEDGCPKGFEQYCACIPVRADQYSPYCLDLDHMTCNPVSSQPDCKEKEIVVPTQGECVAMMYQSVKTPACKVKTESFCRQHSAAICDETGNPSSCKKQPH